MSELVIKTALENGDLKMKQLEQDQQIVKKVKDWLKANIKVGCENVLCTDLITDNKDLLKAIKDWEK